MQHSEEIAKTLKVLAPGMMSVLLGNHSWRVPPYLEVFLTGSHDSEIPPYGQRPARRSPVLLPLPWPPVQSSGP